MILFNLKTLTALILVLILTIFTNCNETKRIIQSTGSEQLTGTYNVSTLNGTITPRESAISFKISEANKTIKGTTGCNSFFGAITKEGNSFRITEISISENYCDEEVIKTEQHLMRAFNSTATYILKEEILSLYSESDHSSILNAIKDTIQ